MGGFPTKIDQPLVFPLCSYEIHAGTSEAAHKVFQQRGTSSIREFSLLQSLQFFAGKLWLKIGCVFNWGCVFNQAYYGSSFAVITSVQLRQDFSILHCQCLFNLGNISQFNNLALAMTVWWGQDFTNNYFASLMNV